MKKILAVILIVAISSVGCKKEEEEKEYNTLKFTSGYLEGKNLSFSPNKGFWSQVTPDDRSYRLIFGDTKYPATASEYVEVFFYHQGDNTIEFPGIQGTFITMRVYVDEQEDHCSLFHETATLTINELSDTRMKGRIEGDFTVQCSGETTGVEMDFDIELTEE